MLYTFVPLGFPRLFSQKQGLFDIDESNMAICFPLDFLDNKPRQMRLVGLKDRSLCMNQVKGNELTKKKL